ncbi:hypothetical protein [Rhodohalobacter sp. 8-1]|uniref:hypothetical protein n=1 Tax=Rhodohalobacter sp. 8-1 TaxID=3131972 RepID=UPI0030EB81D8
MSIFKSTFEHRVFYNKFVKKYKQADNKISAINDIKTHRDVLADQEKELVSQIAERVEELKTISNTPPGSPDPNERKYHALLKQGMKQVLSSVEKEVDTDNHIQNPSRTLETLQGVIEESFDDKLQSYYPATKCVKAIEEICNSGERVATFREKQRLLNKIIQEALNEDYPDALTTMSPQPTDEREKLKGAAKSKKQQKKDEQAKHYPEILKAADKVIGEKKLSEFITDTGNANSDLYNGILRHYDKVAKSTLKRWLKEDLKSGKFEKKLTKYRQK